MYLQWIKTKVIDRSKISKNYLLILHGFSPHRSSWVNYKAINCFRKLRRKKKLSEQVPLSYLCVLREIDCKGSLISHHSRWLNILHNLPCLILSGNIWKLKWHFGVEFICSEWRHHDVLAIQVTLHSIRQHNLLYSSARLHVSTKR